jgi:hypothetical protein
VKRRGFQAEGIFKTCEWAYKAGRIVRNNVNLFITCLVLMLITTATSQDLDFFLYGPYPVDFNFYLRVSEGNIKNSSLNRGRS